MAGDKGPGGSEERVSYAELLEPFVRPALIIGIGLAIFQQITGINTVIYYAPTILQGVGFSEGGAIAATAVGVGLVNVGFTILSVFASSTGWGAGRCSSSGSSA